MSEHPQPGTPGTADTGSGAMPAGSPTPDVHEMAATAAIRRVLGLYCRSMDRIDAELGYAVWHPDGTAHYSGLYEGSGRGFIDWVCDLHRGMVATSHQVTNVTVDVAGDHAVSEAYVTVRLRTPGPDGALVDIVGCGRYLDRWSCRAGRWAIDHRDYVSDLASSTVVPAGSARSGVPPAAPVAPIESRRDGDDPVYALVRELTDGV